MRRVPIVMRADGSVSAMKATDLKEVAERDRRIHQLEELNRVLTAEVDRMRPVVEAAIIHLKNPNGLSMEKRDADLWMAVTTYESRKTK